MGAGAHWPALKVHINVVLFLEGGSEGCNCVTKWLLQDVWPACLS